MKPYICIYAIMRDEGANVEAWGATTREADRVFVLDTGSNDNTVADLLAEGIEVAQARFDPFRFDDARNTALALAPDADLYLQLDADERLSRGWRAAIENVYDPGAGRYRYRWENHGNASWGVVMRTNLHRRPGYRWTYPCHEVLNGPGPIIDADFAVEHHPDETKSRGQYLPMLTAAAAEHPGDPRMTFYLGREFWYANDWDAAREWMVRFLDLPNGWAPERCEAYRIIAAIDYNPERWLWKAVGECPERREPWVDLAQHYFALGHYEQASMAISQAEQRDDETIYTTDTRCWGEQFDTLRGLVRHT